MIHAQYVKIHMKIQEIRQQKLFHHVITSFIATALINGLKHVQMKIKNVQNAIAMLELIRKMVISFSGLL